MLSIFTRHILNLLEIKWKELTFELFKQGHLGDGLFSKVPSKLCHDPLFLLEINYKISQLTWKPYNERKGDASVCFDLTLYCFTSAVSAIEYTLTIICVVLAPMLKQTYYYFKLMFNITDTYYCQSSLNSIYGNGQASTNFPSA